MLATAAQLPAEPHGWVAEAKLDGARVCGGEAQLDGARVCGGEAQLFSRPGNHLSARFPEVTAALGHRAAGPRSNP
jgi:ATP-dependent DNA ligase